MLMLQAVGLWLEVFRDLKIFIEHVGSTSIIFRHDVRQGSLEIEIAMLTVNTCLYREDLELRSLLVVYMDRSVIASVTFDVIAGR